MNGEPIRTIDPVPRMVNRTCVFTVVDEHLRYVRIYVPFRESSNEQVAATVAHALDTRPAPPAESWD